MRIGVLTTSFPRHRGDYAGAFVLGSVRALAARGHELEVLAPEPSATDAPPHFPHVNVTWLPYARPRTWQQTFYGAGVPENLAARPWLSAGLVSYTAQLLRTALVRARAWDALISHWALPSALVAASVAGARPHLAFCHSADVHALTRSVATRPLRRFLCERGTRFWFVSERHRQAFLGDLDRAASVESHVSGMGIDARPLSDSREACRARWDLDRFSVLALGRMVPIKGLADAISAVSHLQGAELVLAGDGPELDALRSHAEACGVRLRVAGIVSGRDKAQLLRAADALVVPSRALDSGRSEGLPTVITEAQAHGLPVVATRTGGVPGALRDGHDAILVEPERPDQLTRALARLQREPELRKRLSDAGLQRARSLTWDALAPRLEALIQA